MTLIDQYSAAAGYKRPGPRQSETVATGRLEHDLRGLLAQSEASRPVLHAHIREAGRKIGYAFGPHNMTVAPVKSFARAYAKVVGDYDGDVARLCDGCRGMMIFEDDDAEGLIRIGNFYRNHPDQVGFKDKILTPSRTGFRGLNVKMRLPDGHVAEIMVLTRSMAKVYNATHAYMEKAESILRRARAEGLDELPRELDRRVGHFNECARRLHDRAARDCVQALEGYCQARIPASAPVAA